MQPHPSHPPAFPFQPMTSSKTQHSHTRHRLVEGNVCQAGGPTSRVRGENTPGTRLSTRWRRWLPAKSQAGLLPPPLGPLPLPSGISLCQAMRGPGMALGKRPVRWRQSQPRMQSTRRPLPSALPVAKVKGSGSSRRLRPLRLHLLSLRVRLPSSSSPRPSPLPPPGQQTALTETGPAPTSGCPHSSPAAPQRDSRTGSTQHLTMVLSLSPQEL